MTENTENFLKYFGGPLITAVLGATGFWIQDLFRKRDARNNRGAARAEATETVNFIEKWLQTQQLVCPANEFEVIKQTARQQLDQVYATLTHLHAAKSEVIERPLWKRVFLMYAPHGIGGWMTHALFYGLAFLILLWSTLVPGVIIELHKDDSWASAIGGVTFFYLILLGLLLVIRAAAIAIDRRYQIQLAKGSPPPAVTN